MATAPFLPVDASSFAPLPSSRSMGWAHFDKLAPSFVAKGALRVSHVHVVDELLAVTSGPRVDLYKVSAEKREDGVTKLRSIARFDGVAKSARLRFDAKLLVAACENGVVRVFDCETKSAMRTYQGHESSCDVVRWNAEGTLILSGSNDCTARLNSLADEETLAVFKGHGDHVRAVSHIDARTVATGSYDRLVRLWDVRTGTTTCSMNHGHPVEDLLPISSSGSLSSAASDSPLSLLCCGDSYVSRWDLRKLSQAAEVVCHHQKTVTSLSLSSGNSFLLSASLDGSVKICALNDLATVVHSLKFKGSVLSVCLSKHDWRIIAGTAEGELVVRTRKGTPTGESAPSVSHPVRAGTFKHFVRGRNADPAPDAAIVPPSAKRPKLRAHDLHLKEFAYRPALDAALATKEPATVVSVLEELSQRGKAALDVALGGRDEAELEPLLAFCTRYVAHPVFAPTLVPVTSHLVSCYAHVLGESAAVDALFKRLARSVHVEASVGVDLAGMLGQMGAILGPDA